MVQANSDPPYTNIDRTSTADGEDLLDQVHYQLLAYHKDMLVAAGLYDKAAAQVPTNALLSMWDPKSPGFGAGTVSRTVAVCSDPFPSAYCFYHTLQPGVLQRCMHVITLYI